MSKHTLGTQLVIEALGDSYYPDLGQTVSAEKMIEIIDSNPTIQATQDMLEVLKGVVALHDSQVDAQKKHYGQNWYQEIKRDGLKYDVAVCSTLNIYEEAKKAILKAEGKL